MSGGQIGRFHVARRPGTGPGVFESAYWPTPEEQIAALNRALTDEVLRHAKTRLKLQSALEWCRFLESLPGEVVDDD